MITVSGVFVGAGVAPSVVSASMAGRVVTVLFSEPMDPTTLVVKENYSIDGMTILRVDIVPKSNNTKVALTVTGFLPSTLYTVVVTGVTDTAGNSIAIDSQTILPIGIASGSAFGTATVTVGAAAYFYDTFSRADNSDILATPTPDIGNNWESYIGSWGITGGKLAKTNGGVDSFVYVNATATDNFEVSLDIDTISGTRDFGIVFRAQGGSGGGYFFHSNDTHTSLYRYSAPGSYTQISAPVGGALIAGDAVAIRVQGSNIEAYINGILKASATDSTYTGTRIGMYGGGGQTAHRWDNLRVTEIVP